MGVSAAAEPFVVWVMDGIVYIYTHTCRQDWAASCGLVLRRLVLVCVAALSS
jgi:hypothetical protein